jgi:hypothetical protein
MKKIKNSTLKEGVIQLKKDVKSSPKVSKSENKKQIQKKIAKRLIEAIKEVKLIEEGKIKGTTIEEFIDQLRNI